MNSAAASRFAARYGVNELPQVPLENEDCPTSPIGIGAPFETKKAINSNNLAGWCPTSPTCPTHFEGVGDENSPADGLSSNLTDGLGGREIGYQTAENGGKPPFMASPVLPVAARNPAIDSRGLAAEDREDARLRLKTGVGHPEPVGHPDDVEQASRVGHQEPDEDTEEAERRLRVEAGIADIAQRTMGVPQTIPHDAMVAGLLAASMVRTS